MLFHTSLLTNFKNSFTWLYLIFLLVNLCRALASTDKSTTNNCKYCQYLVRTFMEGLNKTEQLHFGGGNTDWEERKLGKFKTSETRFVEIMEYVCKKDSKVSLIGKDSVKDLQFNCHTLAEEQEEHLENWFFNRQDRQPDLEKFLCVEELKRCCSPAFSGPNAHRVLDSKGSCEGDGSRVGQGKCECETGYVGKMCSNCDAHYFPTIQNSTFLECSECFDGCASGCTAAGPKGCRACRTGYKMDAENGCVDINECLVGQKEGDEAEKKCILEHEVCINTPGSYYCDCALGYVKKNKATGGKGVNAGEEAECVLDVEDHQPASLLRPDTTLRLIAIVGLLVQDNDTTTSFSKEEDDEEEQEENKESNDHEVPESKKEAASQNIEIKVPDGQQLGNSGPGMMSFNPTMKTVRFKLLSSQEFTLELEETAQIGNIKKRIENEIDLTLDSTKFIVVLSMQKYNRPAESASTSSNQAEPKTQVKPTANLTPVLVYLYQLKQVYWALEQQSTIDSLEGMGYPREEVQKALKAAFFDAARAVEYLCSGIPDNIPAEMLEPEQTSKNRLDHLADSTAFQQIREQVNENPAMLLQVLQEIAAVNPKLMRSIREDPIVFLQLLGGRIAQFDPEAIIKGIEDFTQQPQELSEADQAAVTNLQAFDEALAANYILQQMEEEGADRQ
uniref:UBA domain-containing protein n=1 Tax=Ditylenchus dipsaci TaxID=166011 RepID=A0A915DA12_9BILA